MKISMKQIFISAATLATTFDMPAGYRRMVRLMLAWELLPDYPGMSPEEVARLEKDKNNAMANVKRGNIEPVKLRSEAADMGFHGGAYTDWRLGL